MGVKQKVLVVDDETAVAVALKSALEDEGFEVETVRDGESAIETFEIFGPDIVLMETVLPNMSGVDVCRTLRARRSRVPIVMVSGKTSELDVVVGLEVGADDYVSKPFRMRELIARVRALLRRTASDEEAMPEGVLEANGIRLDTVRHEVAVAGREVNMPLKEFELLGVLMANAGRVLTREVIIRRVWGDGYVGDTKTLDVHVKRLRTKVEEEPSSPLRIQTVRGVGYKFAGGGTESPND